jgi:hypothetical protein
MGFALKFKTRSSLSIYMDPYECINQSTFEIGIRYALRPTAYSSFVNFKISVKAAEGISSRFTNSLPSTSVTTSVEVWH